MDPLFVFMVALAHTWLAAIAVIELRFGPQQPAVPVDAFQTELPGSDGSNLLFSAWAEDRGSVRPGETCAAVALAIWYRLAHRRSRGA